MSALAIPPSWLWRKALIRLLLLYEAEKLDAATEETFIFLTLCNDLGLLSASCSTELGGIPALWSVSE